MLLAAGIRKGIKAHKKHKEKKEQELKEAQAAQTPQAEALKYGHGQGQGQGGVSGQNYPPSYKGTNVVPTKEGYVQQPQQPV
ncbi:uncharacterized protein I303_108640 [Kwoniella dejecticola CBS 10117]|uniref:Uncharacterized protein n=1 Tax=Kwoniella dejecticola CBS 10117 TaxID=1296121 RepID=A0A1A5ZWT8_9TREE|nr:uncharacterized protein I303_07035 [Kwoniella dejecticola CBS 10117]OBR82276.1 hypothetical protein I303_07035 [Kwoniella dejecticola CBS 10117]